MAGRVRLAVTGIQDRWFTGEPQFSYFIMNYKRHTRFATEAIETPFDGQMELGHTITCRIPNNVGDLVRSTMLKVLLNPVDEIIPRDENNRTMYNTSIGSRIIAHADLVIGGQTIERITGEYIYMYDQIHNSKDDVLQTLYFLNGHGNHIDFVKPYTLYVNLPFYFFRHPSLAIPMCAITKQLIEVRITFKPPNYKIAHNYEKNDDTYTVTPVSSGNIQTVSLITDYYFITDDEKNFLKTRPVEYVITQLQMSTIPMKPELKERAVLVKFEHPVKELMFVATLNESETPREATIVTTDPMSPVIPIRSDHRRIKRIALDFNGMNVFDQNGISLAYEQSLRHHTGVPSPAYVFYTYSFAMNPEVYYPTGQVNMSRIIHKKLTIELDEVDSTHDTIVNVYALNYNVLRIESGLAGLKF